MSQSAIDLLSRVELPGSPSTMKKSASCSDTNKASLQEADHPRTPPAQHRAIQRLQHNNIQDIRGSRSLESSPVLPHRRQLSVYRKDGSEIHMKSLDLCMYELENKGDDDIPVGLMSQNSRGRLSFSLAYDMENECLTVCILEARLLKSNSSLSYPSLSPLTPPSNTPWCHSRSISVRRKKIAPDTCVLMRLYRKDGTVYENSTKTCKNTFLPAFGASYCFSMTSDELEPVELEMVVYECDRYLKKCEIGTIKMDLKEAAEPLRARKLVEMWRDLVPQLKPLFRKGKLELSLSYRSDQEALQVGVATVRNLESTLKTGQIFVKTLLIADEKVISMRQTGFHMHSFECTILNEKYAIPVKKHQLERSALIVAVHSHDPGTGGNTEIARCCVGSITYSSGHRLTHWNDVIIYRGHNITRTHSLY